MWKSVSLYCLSLLGGCAAAPPPSLHGPDYFNERTQPDVVLGYFVDPKLLGIASCPYDPEGIVDCFGPNPKVTLVVQEVIFGHVEQARLELLAFDIDDPKNFPIGRRQPVLAYPERWGSLGRNAWNTLHKTRSGEWAIPVGAETDRPWLPCSAEQFIEVHAIEFSRPVTRPLARYEEEDLEELRSNPHVTIDGNVVHIRGGVLLSEVYALRERIPAKLTQTEKILIDACLRK